MYLKKLHLEHVRNLGEQSLDLGPGFNYLYGANGAGKTALLEAVYLLARGRSFRTHKVAPIVASGAQSLIVRGEVVSVSGTNHRLGLSKSKSGQTELRLNGDREKRASSLAQYLPVQILLPEAAELVFGGPGERRAFLDWGLFHVEPKFLEVSRAYRRALMQRNAWLKSQANAGEEFSMSEDPWVGQLIDHGQKINGFRADYLTRLSEYFHATLKRLSPGLGVDIDYYWGGLVSVEETEKKLGESWRRDVKFGLTHRGPHRADLLFLLEGHPAAEMLSRGQAKLVASAAILAQAELLYKQSNTKSLFLIDDFGAELDAEHWQLFLHTLLELECQVIATSTEALDLDQDWVQSLDGLHMFHVEQGKIS